MADSGDVPLLKVGILGDIQGYPAAYDWGMHNLEKAFRLLAPKKPDVLIMDGDLSDCGDSAAFPYYQALVEKYFADKLPCPAVCAGNHDYGRDNDSAHEELCRAVGQSPVNPGHIVVNGYDFIMVSDRVTGGEDGSQHYTEEVLARLEDELKKAVARDPEKPVFVITHFPPSGTMAGSHGAEGSKDLRELFKRYPSVFSISGHTHYPLEDERSIWQGEFTAIQTSSLSYACMEERPFNSCNAIIPFAREAVQCLYMEIYADRLEIHRYNVEDQREIKPDRVWRVPMPFDRATAPYTETRGLTRTAPEFEPGTQAYLRYDYGYLYLIFEGAKHEDPVPFYRLVLRDISDSGEAVFRSENLYVSNFCRLERNRDPRQVIRLPGRDLTPRGLIRAEIYPAESFGHEGKPLIVEFRNPCAAPKPGTTDRPQE